MGGSYNRGPLSIQPRAAMPVNLTAPDPSTLLPVPGVRLGITMAGIRKAAQHHVAQHGIVFDKQDSHGVYGGLKCLFLREGGSAAGQHTPAINAP